VTPSAAGGASTLELASDPALLATARLFAAAAARAAGCQDEVAEDVRLAVSEACAGAMRRAGNGDATVTVQIRPTERSVEVTVSSAATSPPGGAGPDDIDLVTALFPDAVEVERDGRAELRFSAPLAVPAD
jgi:anti-sigma regulatory factor (Ser/Thr protein kinase)